MRAPKAPMLVALIAASTVVTLAPARARAVVVVEGPSFNPSPAGFLGAWNGVSGVAIAQNWIISARHVGGGPGTTFSLDGHDYTADLVIGHPTQDVLIARLSNCGLRVTSFQYVHFIDSLIWLRYCLSDAIRRERPRSDFEAAVMLAVAQQRPTPAWRTAIRRGIARSPFIALVDRAGAYLWPKSFTFVARKRSR